MKVMFIRVLGHKSRTPAVVAIADNTLVKWDKRGWFCACDAGLADEDCDHVEAVAQLLDPKVTGEVA